MTVIRNMKRKFGIAAPRVAIRTRTPWYWRSAVIATLLLLILGIAWFTYDTGRNLAGFQSGQAAAEQARLSEEITHLRDENEAMRSQLAALEGQMQIERATYADVRNQMKTLSDENALLKDDLAFFQTLMASNSISPSGVSINRFRVRRDAMPGEYRYQLLVVQSRTRSREFQGKLQLVVDLVRDGQPQVLVLPKGNEKTQSYNLSFRFYQRVDGVFHVPAEATVKRVQVRVLEDGAESPRSSQSVNLS